jgi:hypothetical protein
VTAEAEDPCVARSREVAVTTAYPASDSRPLDSHGEGRRNSTVYLGGVGPYRARHEEVAAQGHEGFAPTASAVTS